MVLLADLENHARAHPTVFVGTAGSLLERSNADGFRFYAHQFYDGDGKKRERYLAGPVGTPAADALAEELRLTIAETRAAASSLRLLGREGFALADAKTYATLARCETCSNTSTRVPGKNSTRRSRLAAIPGCCPCDACQESSGPGEGPLSPCRVPRQGRRRSAALATPWPRPGSWTSRKSESPGCR